jgi:cellulose synthase/poly-beta-1,6-N-acetylglucosamine synthase-like glycosyltransferase
LLHQGFKSPGAARESFKTLTDSLTIKHFSLRKVFSMHYLAHWVAIALLIMTLALLIPTTLFFVECLMAAVSRKSVEKSMDPHSGLRPSVAVLVPAHNEALGITQTLATLLPQLGEKDRLIVIADNCNDSTAEVSRQAGATVIERQDPERRGKGYALDYGLQVLAHNPPDVVVIVDADCIMAADAVRQIASLAFERQRPVQSIYLLTPPNQSKPEYAISTLAVTVKNWVRLAGLAQMGLHAILGGTGMAFPWTVLQKVSLASGNIVEDMQVSVDLAIAGVAPIFCSSARVTGILPQRMGAATSQRTRWEHGHLQTLVSQVPRLLQAAVQQRRWDLGVFALDLSIPPLSLLVLLWLALAGVATLAAAFGAFPLPAMVAGLGTGLIFTSVFIAWAKFASDVIPAQALLAIPLYILWKIPLYFKFFTKPQTQWVRTERDN